MAFSFDRANRLRIRRIFRRRQRQVEHVGAAAEAQFETNLIARFDRLLHVKRFITGWLALIILVILCTIMQTLALSTYYQTLRPIPGGTYNEGLVGSYSNANPLYASGSVDTAVSHLIFAGLLKYDSHNTLVGDLASGYSVDSSGQHYIVHLKPGLTWQDGQPLTADDVAFTYHAIQNPDANSPFLSSWQGITITAKDKLTVDFDLPNTLSSFAYSLTGGIIPEHILASVPADQLRSSTFNTTQPVGAGPFAWQTLQTGNTADPNRTTSFIALRPFTHYAGGSPKLNGFVVRAYASEDQMVEAYKNRDINAMGGLSEVPISLKGQNDLVVDSFPSTAGLFSFFKTSSGVLSDVQVREALVKGTDTASIIKNLSYQTRPLHEPLLQGQLGYDPKYQQSSFDFSAANSQLESDGWIKGNDGIRSKAGQPLTFRLYGEDTTENNAITKYLISDWKKLGVDAIWVPQQPSDFQTTLEFHTYDALLHSVSIGVDPDVFAYWDSSQADIRANNRLNFSEYKSTVADAALEAGRTRTDPALRVIKYRPFLQAWQTDAPALGLYQPRILYITRGTVYGLNYQILNTASDRYNSVANWEIQSARVTN